MTHELKKIKAQYLVRFWSNDLAFSPAEERLPTLKAAKAKIKEWQEKWDGDSFEIIKFAYTAMSGHPKDLK